MQNWVVLNSPPPLLPVLPLPDPDDRTELESPGAGLHLLLAFAIGASLVKAGYDDRRRMPWLNMLAAVATGVIGSAAGVATERLADAATLRMRWPRLGGEPRFHLKFFGTLTADAIAWSEFSARMEDLSLWPGTSRRTWAIGWPLAVVLLGGNAIAVQSAKRRAAERRNLLSTKTGLRNHTALHADMAELLTKDEPFTVIYIDLDGFKAINDLLGHDAGDEVLREFGEALRERSGHGYHLSGDEFALLIRGHDALELEREVRVALRAMRAIGDRRRIRMGAKFGAAYGSAADGRTGVQLLGAADAAMCRGRAAGGNHLAFETGALVDLVGSDAEIT